MKFQSVRTFQHHSFVRFVPSLQPAIHPPRQSPINPRIHQPTLPHIYLYFHPPCRHPSLHLYLYQTYVQVGSRRFPSSSGKHRTASDVSHSLAIAYTYLLHGSQQPFVGSVLHPALYPTLLLNQSFMTKNMTHFNCMARCTISQLMVVITTPASWHSFQSYV